MLRSAVCLAAALTIAVVVEPAFAQTSAPAATTAATPAAKPSRIKLTVAHLKEMRAKWALNRPKMKACRAEVKSKGLTGDDRWFYMEDCMGRS
jgi:psiF repeat